MRITVVTRELPPLTSYSGGIGYHFAATVRELVRQGHGVDVLTLADAGTSKREWEGAAVAMVRRRGQPIPTRLAWAATVDRWLAAHPYADVVFAPEWGGEAAMFAGRESRTPLVTNLATSLQQIRAIEAQPISIPGRAKDLIQSRLERRQTEQSEGVLACTNAILSWAERLWDLDATKRTVLPNFVDAGAVREAAQAGEPPAGWPTEGPVVLFFGRLEQRKGVHILAKAIPLIREQVPAAQFVFIGGDATIDGRPSSDVIRELAGADAAPSLHLLGRQDPSALLPAVAAADVVAFPSIWENFSIAAVEARALGRPIVATAGSGFDDFVSDGVDGVLVPPREAVPLADALVRLLGDPAERAALGAAAQAATDALSPERVVRQYVEFFESVAR